MTLLTIVLVGLAALLYLRSPIDLLPDSLGIPGLLDDLAVLIIVSLWARRRWREAGKGSAGRGRTTASSDDAASRDRRTADPYAVLGVRRDADAEEVTRAYREQMKRYHPDRVADLGAELREMAHRKTIEIQRAYETLQRRP